MTQEETTPPPTRPSVAALPPDAVLVHVGLHKTGTTALQSIFEQLRPSFADHGLTYPGQLANHHPAALALTETHWGPDAKAGPPVSARHWQELARLVDDVTGRVLLSSEFFNDVRDGQGERLVGDLGAARVHVVMGVRHIGRIASSAWQQTLKLGRISTFEQWLKNVYLGPRDDLSPRAFWSRYDYGAAAERWAGLIGPDRVHLIVLDEQDRPLQPATFEGLLALPDGMLSSVAPTAVNRSMTAGEAEAVRRANTMMRGKVAWNDYEAIIRRGAVSRMVEGRAAAPYEAGIDVPGWLLEHSSGEGRDAAARIAAAGVHVHGDLGSLGVAPAPRPEPARFGDGPLGPRDVVPVETLAEALVGAVAGGILGSASLEGEPDARRALVVNSPASYLVRVLAGRARQKARRIAHKASAPTSGSPES